MERIGKYEILSELGKGGMGMVFKGRDTVIGRDVAIKVIQEDALQDETIKKRFYREARSAGRLSHPNITIIHDIGEEGEAPYLVMEYLEGSDLRAMLRAGTPLSNAQKLSIATQICSGLHYAHTKEIIHRDVKPENIRVLPDGTVKIMDFGIARIQSEAMTLTNTNVSMGTPRYMAPEQVRGEEIDHRADIFSFGVLLYELLTGDNPFAGENVTTIIYKILNTRPMPLHIEPDVLNEELQPIVSKCLAKNREERYASFADVLADLRAVSVPGALTDSGVGIPIPLASVPGEATPRSLPTPVPDRASTAPLEEAVTAPIRKKSRKALWAVLGVVLLGVLAGGGYVAVQQGWLTLPIGAASEPPEPAEPAAPEVTAVTVAPNAVSVGVGERAFVNVTFQDAQGTLVMPRDLDVSVQWSSADTTIAVVAPMVVPEDTTSLGGLVTGRRRGGTTLAVVVGPVVQFVSVKVGVSEDLVAEAEQAYLAADSTFRNAEASDSLVQATFAAVQDSFDYVLPEERLAAVESTMERLSATMTAFAETAARVTADTLTMAQKRAAWQGYLDAAPRQSPATRQAAERVAEIDDLLQRTTVLEDGSLVTCDRAVEGGSSGGLRLCRDSAVGNRFEPRATVFLNARVNAPRAATIRWEWRGPDGTPVKQNRTSVVATKGYRVWDVVSNDETQAPGAYQVLVYNERDLLIGRRTFVIE